MVFIYDPISYIFVIIFTPRVVCGLFKDLSFKGSKNFITLELRSYLFILESEDKENTTHEHSWKRGGHENKVSVLPPLSPLTLSHCTGSIKFTSVRELERLAISESSLEIIKFTPSLFLLPLLLVTTTTCYRPLKM